MNRQMLQRAIKISKTLRYVILATSDINGVPHIATASNIQYDSSSDLIKVSEWFCTKTVSNLQVNQSISIVAWNPKTDRGYQLVGQLEGIQDTSVLDGFAGDEAAEHIPQTGKQLLIKIEVITTFNHAIHSDENLIALESEIKQ